MAKTIFKTTFVIALLAIVAWLAFSIINCWMGNLNPFSDIDVLSIKTIAMLNGEHLTNKEIYAICINSYL